MTTDEAHSLGIKDGEYIRELVNVTQHMVGNDGCTVLVDGSMFSPSWRALPNGPEVWDYADQHASGDTHDAFDAYTEGLDKTTLYIRTEIGHYVSWEEGCLYLFGPNHEDGDDDGFDGWQAGR